MITFHKKATYNPDRFLISRGIDPDRAVFFDIEATGLKAAYSHLYLIGAAHRLRDGSWQITQWMAERPQEEAALIRTFDAYLKPYTSLIHFNGNRFDIPYILEKEEKYGLETKIRDMKSEDIYLSVRPLRKLLKMHHMNQKSLEQFMGVDREDPFDGGQLINVYRDWIKDGGEERLQALLLHNSEDVDGMLLVMGLYAYLPLVEKSEWKSRIDEKSLILTLELPDRLPHQVDLKCEKTGACLFAGKDIAQITVPCLEEELRYYFPDWKNYYYLPMEDMAIHKSVAVSVDSRYREKAKAWNCYVRKEGVFLPQPDRIYQPAFRRKETDGLHYFEVKEELVNDAVFASDYAAMMVDYLARVKE